VERGRLLARHYLRISTHTLLHRFDSFAIDRVLSNIACTCGKLKIKVGPLLTVWLNTAFNFFGLLQPAAVIQR
jgi:hypothetical protein